MVGLLPWITQMKAKMGKCLFFVVCWVVGMLLHAYTLKKFRDL